MIIVPAYSYVSSRWLRALFREQYEQYSPRCEMVSTVYPLLYYYNPLIVRTTSGCVYLAESSFSKRHFQPPLFVCLI